MARRRKNKGEAALLGLAAIIGIPVYAAIKVSDAIGPIALIFAGAAVLVLIIWYRLHRKAKRLAYLRARYGDEQIVQNIMRRLYWQGQTADQLSDSIGHPIAKDDQLLKTRKREVWKYHQTGVNRYKLRVTLENDIVTGWDQKH